MSNHTPSNSQLISQSWQVFKKNWQAYYKAFGVMFLVQLISNFVVSYASSNMSSSLVVAIVQISASVLNMIMAMGLIQIVLKIVRGQEFELSELFEQTGKFWRYLGAGLLVALIVGVGLILLVIPGIIWMLKYSFVPYLIIDQDLSVTEALKASAKMTQGFKWQLFFYIFLIFGLNLLGMLALLVGLFVTIPLSGLSFALMYDYRLEKLQTKN